MFGSKATPLHWHGSARDAPGAADGADGTADTDGTPS